MRQKIERLLLGLYSSSPYLELLARKLYWHPFFHTVLSKYKKKLQKKSNKKQRLTTINEDEKKRNKRCLLEGLQSLKIKNGDILLVHSSMDRLKNTGFTPEAVISLLRDLVGLEGTIVMPAFQKFKYPCAEHELMDYEDKVNEEVLVYNYRGVACWTGLLNSIFLMQPDTIRSYFPNNSLAAQGSQAQAMMEHNLEGDLPHGRHSSWEYCIEHHAKVLFLGLKADHCFTLIHTVEDILDEQWPVDGWYRKQKYKIIDGIQEKLITIRQRKLEWAKYITEKYGTNEIRKAGLLSTHEFGGVTVEYIDDANVFFSYLKDKVLHNNLVFYKIPSKFLKKY